ncbi:MAG: hypothetical protein HKN84_08680 [Gammaproteobacteria bacterium]|nr:hypothetical protein [Gammaproteobacteria bacterium]
MKLRILGSSIRLRLSQSDLTALLGGGAVEDSVLFPTGSVLTYRLESSGGSTAEADYGNDRVVIRFPIVEIERLARPDEVTMRAELPLADGRLELRVEKDFRCLSPREGEDDTDLFPNPGV